MGSQENIRVDVQAQNNRNITKYNQILDSPKTK